MTIALITGMNGLAVSADCGPSTPKAPICNISKCTADGWVFWPVEQGTPCENGGTCNGGKTIPGAIEPLQLGKCISPITGWVEPLYFILTVVYAPPGTAGTGAKSSVKYASGSTIGTETTTNKSFKSAVSVTSEKTIAGFVTINRSTGYEVAKGTGEGLAISKGATTEIGAQGSNVDGIDHGRDAILLWLNPRVNILVEGNKMKWTLGTRDGETMSIQYVYVDWLKNPSTMNAGVAAELERHGITRAEYPTILIQNPFANGSTTIDPSRFVQTPTTFPYEPPFAEGEQPLPYTVTLFNETITSSTSSYEKSYTTGLKVGGTDAFKKWAGFNLEVNAAFTWTNLSSSTSSTTWTESASVTVTGPSFGYSGPTNLAVYYDTVFKTFMFSPVTQALKVSGVVRDARDRIVQHQPVSLAVKGVQYRTVTDRKGVYRFFGIPSGAAALKLNNVTQPIEVGAVPIRQNLKVAPTTN